MGDTVTLFLSVLRRNDTSFRPRSACVRVVLCGLGEAQQEDAVAGLGEESFLPGKDSGASKARLGVLEEGPGWQAVHALCTDQIWTRSRP